MGTDTLTPATHDAHDGHGGHDAHDGHGGHGGHDAHAGHGGHGDHAAMFRDRFWLSLALSLPVIATSHMIMAWFGYHLSFPGVAWVAPVLGTVVYAWAGWPFLAGGVAEARSRRPGMMLLVGLAISVAWAASLGTTLGVLEGLDFWW